MILSGPYQPKSSGSRLTPQVTDNLPLHTGSKELKRGQGNSDLLVNINNIEDDRESILKNELNKVYL
jgi:hypothetical protein